MQIDLSPELEQYLQAKIGSGVYGDTSEAVGDAIRLMRENDERLAALRAAVRIGEEQLGQGEGRVYTPEVLERITERAFAKSGRGEPVNSDVVD